MLAFIILLSARIKAQEYRISVDNVKTAKLSLENFSGKLTIEGYNGNEIIITPTNSNFTPPERAEGLMPVYATGTDNTGIGISVEKIKSQVSVKCLLPFTHKVEYDLKVPENLSLHVQSQCQNSCDIFIKNMKNEIEVNNCYSINLESVSGPLVLATISGSIDIDFESINTDKPFSIYTVSGDIDISLPEKTPVNLDMGTVSGSMYSDFELSNTDQEMNQVGGNKITAKLNGGGVRISLVTISGNIYLRKEK